MLRFSRPLLPPVSKVRKGGGMVAGDGFPGATPCPRGVSSDRLAKREEATPKGRSHGERGGFKGAESGVIYGRFGKAFVWSVVKEAVRACEGRKKEEVVLSELVEGGRLVKLSRVCVKKSLGCCWSCEEEP